MTFDVPRTEGRHPLPWFVPALLAALAFAGPSASQSSAPSSAQVNAQLNAQFNARSKAAEPAKRIDINTADVEELCQLPGVGKKRAEAIIAYRARKPFTRPTQLLNIRGIGRKTLERLRPMVYVRAPKKAKATRPRPKVAGKRKAGCPAAEKPKKP